MSERPWKELYKTESPTNAIKTLAQRMSSKVTSSAYGRILGWSNARIPLQSKVTGTRHIKVGDRFDAAGPVWIEAISTFGGNTFEPYIAIGDRVSVSGGLHIGAVNSVTIGSDCLLGSGVLIIDHSHGYYDSSADASSPDLPPRLRPLAYGQPIVVGERCWIGDNVVVLEGVTIGAGSVVGANSVVSRSLPENCVAVGAPAKVVKMFTTQNGWTRPDV